MFTVRCQELTAWGLYLAKLSSELNAALNVDYEGNERGYVVLSLVSR